MKENFCPSCGAVINSGICKYCGKKHFIINLKEKDYNTTFKNKIVYASGCNEDEDIDVRGE